MTIPGGARTLWKPTFQPPCARRTGFYHGSELPGYRAPTLRFAPLLSRRVFLMYRLLLLCTDYRCVHKKHNTLRSTLTPPAVLGRLDRGQAHTPARWKRFSLPLAKKVAKTG